MENDNTASLNQTNSDEQHFHQKTSQIMCQLDYDLQMLSQTAWTAEQRQQLDRLMLSLDQLRLISSNQMLRRPDPVPVEHDLCLTWLLAESENSWPELLSGKKLRCDLDRGLPLYLRGDQLRLRLLWRNLLNLIQQDLRCGWLLSLKAAPEPDGRILLHFDLSSSERPKPRIEGSFWPDYLEDCCRDLARQHDGAFAWTADGYQLSLRLSASAAQPRLDRICRDERIRRLHRGRILLLSRKPFNRLHLLRLLENMALRVDLCESVSLACAMLLQAETAADPYILCIADWQDALFLELVQTVAGQPRQPQLMLSLKVEDWPLLPLDYIAARLPQQRIAFIEQPCTQSQLSDGLKGINLIYAPPRDQALSENLIDPELGLARTGGSLQTYHRLLLRLENELPQLQRAIEQDDPAAYRPALQELAEISHYIGAESLLPQIGNLKNMIRQDEPEPGIREQRRQLLQKLKNLPASIRQICGHRGSLLRLPELPAEKVMLDKLHWHYVLRQIEHASRCQNWRLTETAIRTAYGQRMRRTWQQALELMIMLLNAYAFSRIGRICQLLQSEDDAATIKTDDLLIEAGLPPTGENDDEADPVSSQYS